MKQILSLLRKDIRLFLRNKVAFGLTFIVPLVLVYIFGQVFGVNRSGSGPIGVPIAVVSETDAAVADAIIDAMKDESAFRVVETWKNDEGIEVDLTADRARELIRDNKLRFGLVFPPDTMSEDEFGLRLIFLNNPRNEIETQTVTGLLQKVIFTSAPQALMQQLQKQSEAFIGTAETDKFYGDMANSIATAFDLDVAQVRADMDAGIMNFGGTNEGESAEGENAGSFIDQLVRIEDEQLAGADVKSPGATRVVGGWAIMFLLFSVSGASTSLFEEKQAGIFHRLLASPVKRSHILWSKYLFNTLMGVVQLTVLFLAGQAMFGIEVIPHLPALLIVALTAAIACTAFGMLLSAISPNPAAASGLATFLVLTMSAMGGAWFPTSLMPEFIQSISKLTLVYWSMEGFLAVLWAQKSIVEILPILGILLGMAAVVNVFSVWRFNRGNLFD
ncbi:MAG: ABC transporter permease [Synoicihabitans sp.]